MQAVSALDQSTNIKLSRGDLRSQLNNQLIEHGEKETESLTGRNDDNHANHMNPNNDAYWSSRGYDERPDEWEEASDPANADAGVGTDGGPLSADDY